MLAAVLKSRSLVHQATLHPWNLGFTEFHRSMSSDSTGFLDLNEVERILFPVKEQCGLTDYMVIATCRSTWHVRNIAEALIYKVKQKQEGVEWKLLPTVEGHHGWGGVKWIVIIARQGDYSCALDEKAGELTIIWRAFGQPIRSNRDRLRIWIKSLLRYLYNWNGHLPIPGSSAHHQSFPKCFFK